MKDSFHVVLGPVVGERERKTAFVVLSPVDILAAMAASDRSAWSHVLGWIGYFGLVLGAWMCFFSVVVGAATVSESVGWTIGVLMALLFVVGNFALQVLPTLPGFAWYVRSVTHGGAAFPATLAVEAAGLGLVVLVTLVLQGRKTSFV